MGEFTNNNNGGFKEKDAMAFATAATGGAAGALTAAKELATYMILIQGKYIRRVQTAKPRRLVVTVRMKFLRVPQPGL